MTTYPATPKSPIKNYPRKLGDRESKVMEAVLTGTSNPVMSNQKLDTTNTVVDATTNSKVLAFVLSGMTAAKTFTMNLVSNVNSYFKVNLTGSTATKGVSLACAATDDRVVTIPDATDTLVNLASAQVLENKKLESTCKVVDATDNTKTMAFDLSGSSSGIDTTIVSYQTATHTLSLPVLATNDTVATLAATNAFTGANTHAADEIFLNEKGIKFREATGGGTDAVYVKAPAALAADATVTLPGVVTTFPATQGAAGEVLTNDGAGALSWAAQSFLQQTATGTISSAEVLALNAAPKTLIAAPLAGHIIIVDSIELFLDFGTAAYVRDGGNEELVIQYSGGVDIHAFANATDAFLTSAADARRIINPTIYNSAAANFDPTTGDAEAVVAYITNSEVITGDSPIKYVIRYRDVTLTT